MSDIWDDTSLRQGYGPAGRGRPSHVLYMYDGGASRPSGLGIAESFSPGSSIQVSWEYRTKVPYAGAAKFGYYPEPFPGTNNK